MVRSTKEYNRVLVCVYPDVDLIKSCDPSDSMFSSEDTMDREEAMDECQHLGDDMNLDADADWTHLLDNQPIVLNDRMMTDAVQSPHIQSEHSYSLTLNDEMPQSPFGHNIKLEDYGKDMETECFPTVSMTTATGETDFSQVLIKQEPPSPPPASPTRSHNLSTISSLLNAPSPPLSSASSICLNPQSLLKQPTIVLAARPSALHAASSSRDHQMLFPKVNIKVEPNLSTSGFPLPPTPPSCNGSDSDGSLSPVHGGSSTSHNPSSPPALLSTTQSSSSPSSTQSTGHGMGRKSHAKVVLSVTSTSKHSNSSQAALISSQPKGATGVLILTDEEKRTLLAEGYPIPQRLPLTKAEERSLKKIRRKIKNKISAQESRRKKKEYMDALEKKVELLSSENSEYKKKLDTMEGSNRSLLSQLQTLQAILNDLPNKRCRNATTQTFPNTTSVNPAKSESSRSEMSVEIIDAKGR